MKEDGRGGCKHNPNHLCLCLRQLFGALLRGCCADLSYLNLSKNSFSHRWEKTPQINKCIFPFFFVGWLSFKSLECFLPEGVEMKQAWHFSIILVQPVLMVFSHVHIVSLFFFCFFCGTCVQDEGASLFTQLEGMSASRSHHVMSHRSPGACLPAQHITLQDHRERERGEVCEKWD